ncbi:MAG: hypothetical protein ACK5X0_17700, partial [Rhodospirillales bacterium]
MPFTTVVARVRGHNKDLELVVPNPSGAKGNYILQWKSLPEVFTLSVHDRVLHRAIGEAMASNPSAVRKATLKTAATGLAGPAAAKQAKAVLKEEEDFKLLIQFSLLSETVAQLSGGQLQITLAHVQSDTGKDLGMCIIQILGCRVMCMCIYLWWRFD